MTADTAGAVRADVAGEAHPRARKARWTAEELQAAFLGDVYRCVSRRLGRREDAEDVTAEVFAAAFQALPRFRGRCDPRLWLLGIARRKVADALRRKRRRPETLASERDAERGDAADALVGAIVSAEDVLQRGEASAVVRGIIDGLRPAWRDALTLHYADGLTVEEVAVVMRRSPGAVNSLLQRARAAVYREGRAYFVDGEENGQ